MMKLRTFVCAVAVLAVAPVSSNAADGAASKSESSALFTQMAPVFQHPRCMSCHTNEPFPRQGDDQHRHRIGVLRGPDDHGAAGFHCSACHHDANQLASGVPGAPDWHLAPLRMGWTGLSPGELCRALLDPVHGGMKPDQFVAHFNSGLVRWAWTPGTDAHGHARSTPPIGYDQFIELTKRWVASGSACPD